MNILEKIKDAVYDLCTTVQDFFNDELTFTRKTVIAAISICTLMGMVWGFIISPIKKGIYINISNNGNNCPDED